MLENRPMKIAILDDYQNVALKMADWTALAARAEIRVFNDHLADVEELVERLARFDSAGQAWELLTSCQKGSRFWCTFGALYPANEVIRRKRERRK